MSTFTLTDAAIERALAPGLDVTAPNDFTEKIATAIAPMPRQSRTWSLSPTAWRRHGQLVTQLVLLLLLLLALLVGAIAVASLQRRALVNGHVIVARDAELLAIDPETGVSSTLVTSNGNLFGVARSVDGSLISFWAGTPDGGTTLAIVDEDGGNERRLAANVIPAPVSEGQIDVWSPDRRSLAAGVLIDGVRRILVVDIPSGSGEIIGPIGAGDPLWSPDGQLLAFDYSPAGAGSVLAVMHPDGTGVRDISGDLGGFGASGANNWSPDGAWVYFGAELGGFTVSHIYRANVAAGYSEQLTFKVLSAAPALSPDGTTVAYSDWLDGIGTQNLMLMDADGANQRLLLTAALNDGWSNDGEFLLTEWRPPGAAASELMVLRPDGTDRQTLITFEGGCVSVCAQNLGWGQPRP